MPAGKEPLKRLLNSKEAADYVGCAPQHLRNLIHKGELPFPYIKHGRMLLFDKKDLDRWVDSLKRWGPLDNKRQYGEGKI